VAAPSKPSLLYSIQFDVKGAWIGHRQPPPEDDPAYCRLSRLHMKGRLGKGGAEGQKLAPAGLVKALQVTFQEELAARHGDPKTAEYFELNVNGDSVFALRFRRETMFKGTFAVDLVVARKPAPGSKLVPSLFAAPLSYQARRMGEQVVCLQGGLPAELEKRLLAALEASAGIVGSPVVEGEVPATVLPCLKAVMREEGVLAPQLVRIASAGKTAYAARARSVDSFTAYRKPLVKLS
jgi:hypothetical protein